MMALCGQACKVRPREEEKEEEMPYGALLIIGNLYQ